MRRTEQAQGLRLMKFEEVYGRSCCGVLGQAAAAEILGVSERTFRRWRDRFEADGAEGLYDRRLGRVSARRAPIDEVARVLELFDTRYWDFTAKHFHEKLVAEHGCGRSYNWVRLTLQAYGRRRAAPRRGAHRRKRPRRALPGMMVHQDGSRHGWLAGQPPLDLIVTMDDATSEIYSAFFVEEEGTMSSFRALSEVIGERGLFCSLYADRASHYWHTPDAGGKVDKDNPTQVGRALQRLGIELIAAYSPEARGRSERMFGTLQKRLPQELRLAGITGIDEANRFLKEVYLPQHNARFATPAEDQGTAFVPFAGALDDILCIHEDRTVANDNTVRYKRLALQIPADRHRRHYVKATVRVHEYPDGTLAVFHGPRCLARYKAGGEPIDMNEAWNHGIFPAVRDAGYEPVRIDQKEHVNKIDDEIVAEIRRARFVVADFTQGDTGARGGVYYEAGFAQGLGIRVIFSCRKDRLEEVHFDTRQYNHIVWETPEDLRDQLAKRIAAVLGDGPNAPPGGASG